MDTAVVQQFLDFFQDYIDLCLSERWPDNNTTEQELRNAFLLSQHVEKCLDKLHKKGIIDEFLSVLNSNQNASNSVIHSFLLDPPKYILKKVINSNTKINQMDISFKLYLELFSEDKLQVCLTDLMVEAASKDTLLSNLNKDVERGKIIKLKSEILLNELSTCDVSILALVGNSNETTMEVFVFCLLINDLQYTKSVNLIKETFLTIISSKECVYRNFWRLLFKVNDKYFIEMCVENSDIYKLIVIALLDYGKLLKEGMSTDSFYIDVGMTELQNVVKRIYSNDILKVQFFSIVNDINTDVEFWNSMM